MSKNPGSRTLTGQHARIRVSRNRTWKLSVRTLLLLTMVVASGLGLYNWIQVRHQRAFEAMVAESYEAAAQRLLPSAGKRITRLQDASSGQPISNAIVRLTLIGPDGGDGGFQMFATDEDGFLRLHHPLRPGRYQYDVILSPTNRDRFKAWTEKLPYLAVAADPSESLNDGPAVLTIE